MVVSKWNNEDHDNMMAFATSAVAVREMQAGLVVESDIMETNKGGV